MGLAPTVDINKSYKATDIVDGFCDNCQKPMTVYWWNYKKSKIFPLLKCRSCHSTQQNAHRTYPTGKLAPAWKGGKYTSSDGYHQINVGDGTYKREHTLVMEGVLGRPLIKGECVHHKDGDKINNNQENLILCSNSGHRKMHASLEQVAFALVRAGTIVFDDATKTYKLKEHSS